MFGGSLYVKPTNWFESTETRGNEEVNGYSLRDRNETRLPEESYD